MSRQLARSLLTQCNGRPSLIAASYATPSIGHDDLGSLGFIADIRELAVTEREYQESLEKQRRVELSAAYGGSISSASDKPFVFVNGKAIIPIHGMLINRFSCSWGFVTGYNFIRNQVAAAMADDDVDGIVYDVDSYGGTVAGCAETSDVMYAANKRNGGKPSIAVIDSACFSAGYYLASAADKIVCTPTGGAGSIGVMMMHADMSGALEKWGIKITLLYAGDHKVDGNPYQPLSKDVTADLNDELGKLYDQFVSTVVRNRPSMTDKQVRDTQARAYFVAQDALDAKLVDAIGVAPNVLETFFADASDETDAPEDTSIEPEVDEETDDGDEDEGLDIADDDPDPDENPRSTDEDEEYEMATEPKPAVAAPPATVDPNIAAKAAADARVAERARVQGILNHAEAEGRGTLANHLAMNTDMDVEAAATILKASPKAAAPVAPVAAKGGHFKNAMDNSKHPEVGVGGDAEGEEVEKPKQTAAERIIANQRKAFGAPPKVLTPQELVAAARQGA